MLSAEGHRKQQFCGNLCFVENMKKTHLIIKKMREILADTFK